MNFYQYIVLISKKISAKISINLNKKVLQGLSTSFNHSLNLLCAEMEG